ncbi:MAG: TetR/AcrR family transcriptional regulator [Endomicrobiaceae bacterium]|nr:TetR/AcrR family transcriptional regulator [Endomicrobiaceae bacterium]
MKTKILKTAFDLIGKKSVKSVSMQEIAQSCNITKPSLYYYFKSKDEICYTIIKFIIEDQKMRTTRYIERNVSLKDILIDIFQNAYKTKVKKSLGFFLHVVDYVREVPVLEKKFKVLKEENEKSLKCLFEREVKNNNINKENLEVACYLLEACLHHIVFAPSKSTSVSPNSIAESILKAIDYKKY